MSVAAPLSAAEALSSLLWQPYECRSPPLPRSHTDGALALRWWGTRNLQSPSGGRHARASPRAHTLCPVMRLPVPAPSPGKPESVSVRVSGEPARPENVSSVNIVQVSDPPSPVSCSNSAVQTERQRSTASAECQTEEPARRRRPRRLRAARCVSARPDVPPPPYSTLPHAAPAPIPLPAIVHAPPPIHPPPAIISTTHSPHHRFPFQPIPFRSGRGAAYACSEGEGTPKSCCGRPPLRLCVLFLGVVGACLVAAGAVLGALRPHPRAPLTLLLLMIGIGVVLVTAAGLAWRLGARDAPCALLGLRRASCRRFVPRLPPSYARPHHPYAAMLYPEFQYRPPPPSYQASMQEYRLRLLLLDRSQPAVSPPPTYRSNTTSLVRGSSRAGWCGSEYSGPPSYRAPRSSPAVTVTDAIPTLTQLELKYPDPVPESEPKIDQEKDPEHLVTIVHTDAQPVIVTVSGSTALNEMNETHAQPPTEIDILAHL